jgi:hypothetical protein
LAKIGEIHQVITRTMIYGGASEFRQKITEPAMNNNLQKINNAMFNALTKINERLVKKYGFL